MSTRHPLTIPDEWILRDDDGSYWCRGLGSPWWVNTPKGGDAQARESHDHDEGQHSGVARLHHGSVREPQFRHVPDDPKRHDDDLDAGDHRAVLVFVAVTALVRPRSGRPVAEPSPG